ncbi:unnamed protein product [Porites lobata]|uniref:Multidrug resistance-associated protein 4 n=1 Tax=Porites lobata TaxID=104759 RepID=A0ABN8NNT1_9CNID|nr:unnamed protein product [Porites lobata]
MAERTHNRANPMVKATYISKFFTYWWMNDLFKKGYKQNLENSDIYQILPEEESEHLADRLESLWNEELKEARRKNRRPKLRNAFLKFLGWQYFILTAFPFIEESMKVVAPLIIGRLLSYFTPVPGISKTEAYIMALLLSITDLTQAAIHAPNFFKNQRHGLHLRIAAGTVVYRKVLRLSQSALSQTTTGQIVNLMTSDVQKLEQTTVFAHYIWIAPLAVCVVAFFCWQEVGLAVLPGVFLFLCLVPFQWWIGRFFVRLRSKIAALTDERIKVMNEIISGMRVIKMYTWEKPFAKLVANLRRQEINQTKWYAFFRAINGAFYISALAVISFVVFTTYVMTEHTITPERVFVVLGLFLSVRVCFTLFFSLGIMNVREASVTEKRIQKFLELEDRDPNMCVQESKSEADVPVVVLNNITAYWDKSLNPTLKDITFEAKSGELHIVVGPVGAGKTSLLMTMLGELAISDGQRQVRGKVGYSSQQPWIFSGTVKENIVFGQEFNKVRYQQVINACALKKDLKLFHSGDSTLVGERGVVLSGGQKARISLARAVYYDADIYLLDDPLSAVDTHVGRKLFDKCISEFLEHKICILVTHQVQYLKDATSIFCLQEGCCVGEGTMSNLSKSGLDVQSLVSIPGETDTESVIAADDVHVEEKIQDTKSTETAKKQNVTTKEDRYTGTVTWRVYVNFWLTGGGAFLTLLLLIVFLASQAVLMGSDWWLAQWADTEERQASLLSNSTDSKHSTETRQRNIGVYCALVFGSFLLAFAGSGTFLYVAVSASQKLHNQMFEKLLGATIYFFDTNPVGKVLNRFSKDIGQMDDLLPYAFYDYTRLMVSSFAILLLNVATMPYLLAAAIPIVAFFLFIRNYYLKSAREIKRLEAMNRNPFYSHLSASIQGLTTIRAYTEEERFRHQFHVYHDDHTASWFLFMTASRWLGSRLDFICSVFVTFAAFTPLLMAEGGIRMSAGLVGLSLTYAKVLTGSFQWCIRQSAEVENLMTSVERVMEYTKLEQESQRKDKSVAVPDSWPKYGIITSEGLYYSHHHTLPYVLKKLNFCIRAKEKVGVVGRTGAGKSSLMAALFRLAEPEGNIRIDAVPITDISLSDLRSNLSIIPQDPVLFSGSVRKNLDPFNQYGDSELWNALEEVQLKETVSELPDGLETKLTEGGSNFSVGQRQLVCLARAILKHNKILVIDEATANVDLSTDALIQETIRSKFQRCTVLTIAHRLNTIMDSDRVMVLDEGKLVEFDEPYLLLRNEESIFSQMVEHTSRQLASNLYDVAREAYFARHEITDDSEVDVIPRYMNGDVTPLQEQRPNDDDSDDFPSPRFRRSSSIEKERLLFESTV